MSPRQASVAEGVIAIIDIHPELPVLEFLGPREVYRLTAGAVAPVDRDDIGGNINFAKITGTTHPPAAGDGLGHPRREIHWKIGVAIGSQINHPIHDLCVRSGIGMLTGTELAKDIAGSVPDIRLVFGADIERDRILPAIAAAGSHTDHAVHFEPFSVVGISGFESGGRIFATAVVEIGSTEAERILCLRRRKHQ